MTWASLRRIARGTAFCLLSIQTAGGCKTGHVNPPVQFTSEDWSFHGAPGRKLSSDHYVLYTTHKAKPFVDSLPGFMESSWAAYEKVIPSQGGEHKCDSYLFGTRAQWERFSEEFSPARAETYKKIRSGGYSERGITASHYDSQRSTLSVLAHEGLHQYLEVTRGKEIPAWLNEGLACYFEMFDLDYDNRPIFRPEANTLRLPGLREAVLSKGLIPLKDILNTNAGLEVQKKSTHVRNYYSQEWALVLFLMRPAKHNPYSAGFHQLLAEVGTENMTRRARAIMAADTEGNMGFGEAVFRAYITDDLEGFQGAYESYIQDLVGMKG